MPNGPLSLPARLYLLAWDTSKSDVTGATRIHDLFMVFRGAGEEPLFNFDNWKFAR